MKHILLFLAIISFTLYAEPNAEAAKSDGTIIEKIAESGAGANTYIIASGGEAAIIDAGADLKKVSKIVDKYKLTVKYIILTHGHSDHILYADKYKAKYNAIVALHSGDLSLSKKNKNLKIDTWLKGNETFYLAGKELKIIHTPGHSRGGISILFDGKVFTGDALFRESIGRTDLSGGNFEELIKSIKTKLFVLPDGTPIYPGHGEPSTIGYEKKNNPFF